MTRRKIFVYVCIAILLLGVVLFIYRYGEKLIQITVPFFMAMIIAYLVHPLIVRMERKKIPRTYGIVIIYLLFIVFMLAVTVFIVPEIINNSKELMTTLPDIAAGYQGLIDRGMSFIRSSKWSPDVKNAIYNEVDTGIQVVQNYLAEVLRKSLVNMVRIISAVFDLVLAMIIAYYFLKDASFFREAFLSLIPRRWRNGFINTGREINGVLSNFIQGQLTTALIVGTLETIGLLLVRVKYPLVLGAVGGLANIIPYFGPFLGAIPAVAVALLDSPIKALWAAIVFIIVQQMDNSFISPKIIEGKLGLHPVTTILAVLTGGEFFGILGMLLAVPVTAILKVILKRLIEAVV
jgi:predicted PurR-regulated permease PerM